MNLLFVCSKNRKRSPTAELALAGREGLEVVSAGINSDSPTPLSGDLIEWADVVFVMEEEHRNRVMRKYAAFFKSKKLIVLGIPDHYEYGDPELIALFEEKLQKYL